MTKCKGADGTFIDCVTVPLAEWVSLHDTVELQAIDLVACCVQLGGTEEDCIK